MVESPWFWLLLALILYWLWWSWKKSKGSGIFRPIVFFFYCFWAFPTLGFWMASGGKKTAAPRKESRESQYLRETHMAEKRNEMFKD